MAIKPVASHSVHHVAPKPAKLTPAQLSAVQDAWLDSIIVNENPKAFAAKNLPVAAKKMLADWTAKKFDVKVYAQTINGTRTYALVGEMPTNDFKMKVNIFDATGKSITKGMIYDSPDIIWSR